MGTFKEFFFLSETVHRVSILQYMKLLKEYSKSRNEMSLKASTLTRPNAKEATPEGCIRLSFNGVVNPLFACVGGGAVHWLRLFIDLGLESTNVALVSPKSPKNVSIVDDSFRSCGIKEDHLKTR